MKKILTILFILISVIGYSQNTTPQFLGGKTSNLIVQGILNLADSSSSQFNFLLKDTTAAKLLFSGNLKGRWARQNGRLYYNPTGSKFMLADSITGGGGGNADSATFYTNYRADTSRTNIYAAIASSGGSTDTSSLSTRIDARVKYTDTASMLAPYAQTSELTNQTGSDGSLKSLTITGTNGSGHIHLRHQSVDATATGSSTVLFADVNGDLKWKNDGNFYTTFRDYLNTADRVYSFQNKNYTVADSADVSAKLNISDTAAMLTNYATEANLADTASVLRVNIASKQSFSDTTTWDATKANLADSSALLRSLISSGGVVAASVAEINAGADNTKFASPLGLAGSEYLDQSGTKLSGTTAGTATAYTLTLNPAITAYTAGLSLWVKFHLANTGAATINVNGLGAKSLVKDISTALVANDIPINQWYTLVYDGTNFLIQDIGFGGVNLSARLLGALSDETGTGVAVFGTSPTFTTSILGGATFSAFNTVTTNLSIGGAATTYTEGAGTTTYTLGGTPTTALTANFFANATANTITKTLNFGTGGASGSTTAINVGSATSGATNNIKMNITPASDATGDLWYRNASGFMTRLGIGTAGQVLTVAAGLPSWAAAGGGSGWSLTGNSGLSATTNFIGNTDNIPFRIRVNNVRSGDVYGDPQYHAYLGYSAGNGSSGLYNTGIGTNSLTAASVISVGNAALGFGTLSNTPDPTYSVAIGYNAGKNNSTGSYNFSIGGNADVASSGNARGNLSNVIWTEDNDGGATSATTPKGRVAIGQNNPNDNAVLTLTSTAVALMMLTPITAAQKASLTGLANGHVINCSDCTATDGSTGVLQMYNGTTWKNFW